MSKFNEQVQSVDNVDWGSAAHFETVPFDGTEADEWTVEGLKQYAIDNCELPEERREFLSSNGVSFGYDQTGALVCNEVLLLVDDYLNPKTTIRQEVSKEMLLRTVAEILAESFAERLKD